MFSIMGVNFKAIVNVTQIMVKKMIAAKIEGSIVHISSYAGKIPLPQISMYSASKAAVIMLTKCMAMEFGPYKIRVNSVCPTYMITDFTKEYIDQNPERFKSILDKQCFKKFLDPVEAAKLVRYLSSNDAGMINGTSVDIDGGAFC
jgi:L-xylulose reductase